MRGAPTAAGLGVALALAGLGFGLPSLVVAGVGMAGLAGLAVAWVELALPRELIRLPGPPRVVEGEPFELRLQTVGGRVPPPAGELTDPVLSEPVAIGPRWRRSMITEVSISGRGRHRLRPTRLEIRDPLGLHVRAVESADPGELLVLPRVEPVVAAGGGAGGTRASVLAGLESGTAVSQVDARAIELEVDGLRSLPRRQPGLADPLAGGRPHRGASSSATWSPGPTPHRWSSSTRPVPRARRRSTPPCAPPLRSAHHLAGRGGCAVLLPDDRRPTEIESDLRAWPQVHARLALVEPATSPPALIRSLRSGEVYLVSSRAGATIPPSLRGGSGRRFLVTPQSSWKGAAVFTVAGCVGRRVDRARGRMAKRAA